MFAEGGIVLPVSEKKFGNAGAVLDMNVNIMNMKNSTIVDSLVSGVFPKERIPANLTPFGGKSTKMMALPAMEDTPPVDMQSLIWAGKAMDAIICAGEGTFSKVSLRDAINGFNTMHKIDLTTSPGYGFPGKKADYFLVDESGDLVCTSTLEARVEQLRDNIIHDNYDFSSYHKDCLKDELRDKAKVDKPRLFSAAPLDLFVLERQYFSDFMNQLHEDKNVNGIQVGINPLSSEWKTLLEYVTQFGDNVFDGDVSKWDKNMNPAFQRELNAIIVSKFKGASHDRDVVAQLLELMVSCPHVNTDTAYITTHSFPSGRGLTADYNSLMNKFYNVYCFCRVYKEKFNHVPNLSTYLNNVAFVSYGDDSLTGVSDSVKDYFNAKSVQKIFRELGMDFTPADKGEWTYVYRSIYECTFLKRSFRIHHKLGIVAPLCPISMTSTLNYVKDEYRNDELTRVKVQNFQREAYLHIDYQKYMQIVKEFLAKTSLVVPLLSESYLIGLYNDGEYADLLELH
jgi:hypothetical protein